MSNFETRDAATDLAAGRSAYSLARELLGVRAELKTERDQAIHNLNLFETASLNHRATQRRANAAEREIEQIEAEKARLAEELEHTQGQRDAAIQRAQIAEDERHALAAHEAHWIGTSQTVREGLDFAMRYSQGYAPTSMQAVRAEQDRLAAMEAWTPSTSLARRDALMRAEALDGAASAMRRAGRQFLTEEELEVMAAGYRREAEEVGE